MISRNSSKRKYRPRFEILEHKQLLSAGVPTVGATAFVQAAAPSSTQTQPVLVISCGTGKSIRIVTS